MTTLHGETPAERKYTASRGQAVGRKDSPLDEYDSDQIPVLIRLPDMSTACAAATVPQAPEPRAAAVAPSPAVPSGRPVVHPRLPAAITGFPWKGRNWRDVWVSLSSPALVVVLLVSLTMLVGFLMQGEPSGVGVDPHATSAVDELTAMDSVQVDLAGPAVEAPASEPELWPSERAARLSSEREPSSSRSDGAFAGQPAWNTTVAGAGGPSSPTMADSRAAGGSGQPSSTGGQLPLSAAPNTNPGGANGPAGMPDGGLQPVQGWPPGVGQSVGPSDAGRPAGPSDLQPAWGSPAGSPTTPVYFPSSPTGNSPGSQTGEQAWQAPALGSLPETATLNGTIELPQTRADHARTRTDVY